jgi:hypothetical protein
MSSNKFQVLSDAKKTDSGVKYNVNGEIDIRAMIPEFAVMCDAMERGESWYDMMFPRNQDVTLDNSGWTQTGKKRKNPFVDNSYHKNKKPRYN